MGEKRGWYGRLICCKISFIVVLWTLYLVLFYLEVVCKCNWCCYLTTLCCWKFWWQLASSELIIISYSFPSSSYYKPFFCDFLASPFILVLQNNVLGLKFNVNFPMFLFLYKICTFKWWCCCHHVIIGIVVSFINDLIQLNSPLSSCFHYSLVLFYKIIATNEKCEVQYLQFFANHNIQG